MAFKWQIEITVDDDWVADGFEMTDERAKIMLGSVLPFAENAEYSAKVIKSPSQKSIKKIQGY